MQFLLYQRIVKLSSILFQYSASAFAQRNYSIERYVCICCAESEALGANREQWGFPIVLRRSSLLSPALIFPSSSSKLKKNLRGEGLWVGTFRWSLISATLRQIMRFCMGTGKISIGKIPCPQLNLINSKRKTGVFKKFMSEEKGRKSGFYIPSVSMSKWCENDVNSCSEKVVR